MLRGSITRLHPPEYSGEHVRIMNRIALGENIGRFETVRIRSDGQRRQISKSISPIRNASGKIVGASLIASDITDQMVAERNRHQLEVMAASNKKLEGEITRRKALEHDLRTSKRQLASLSREILIAQEEERKRISRDLHDTILQTLVGVSINLASLTQALDENPKKLRGKIDETQSDVEKLLATVHRFAVDLRPEVLEDLGLIPALHAFLKDFMKRTGVRVRLDADGSIAQLPSKLGFILYRVAMEALNNVGLHARATAVAVEIKILSDRLRMKITDDGQSFNVKRVQRAQGGARLGLLGMQERLKIVGGRFSIKSTPGRGTTVTAWIPITLPTAKPAASVVP
jgi:signal transduction histidine kinase